MENVLKFLPLIFSLMSQGGQIADIIKLIVEALSKIQALLPAPAQAVAPLDVRWVQTQLKAFGFDPGPIDGDYGQRTKDAAKAYQAARGLDADGWVGPETMVRMIADGAVR